MFPEFGQAPMCVELDLDSYEGSWTHMAAFRGGGGWVMAARATIQSEQDLMRAMLIAACDEYENPIPSWRAEQLLTCDWSNLEQCHEFPPEVLDDLLCEEEGAFFARWQRQTNADLVALHNRAEHDLAAIDARATLVQRQADREIADLQRRRRHPDAKPEARAALAHLIAQIEAESDAMVADATARRIALRREIDAAEEALWDRGDVLIEVEPMWCVRWAAAMKQPARRSVSRGGWHQMPGADLSPGELARGKLARAMRAASAVRGLPRVPGDQAFALSKPFATGSVAVLPVNRDTRPAVQPPKRVLTSSNESLSERSIAQARIDRQVAHAQLTKVEREAGKLGSATQRGRRCAMMSGILRDRIDELDLVIGHPSPLPDPPPAAVQVAPPPRTTPQADPQPDPWAKARIERDALMKQLAALARVGEKYFSGSPKFRRNRAEQDGLRAKVELLNAMIGDTAPMPAPPPPTNPPTLVQLEEDRARLADELAAHERRGAAREDGKRRFIRYAARRAELQARILRLDAQLAYARARHRTPA